MKYPTTAFLAVLVGSCLVSGRAMADDPVLRPVEVTATVPAAVAPNTERGFTASTLSVQRVSTFGGLAQTNPYRDIDRIAAIVRR